MRGYELCLIIHPDAKDNDIDGLLNSLGELISKHQGRVLKTDKWGKKNFKYQIKKQSRGYYCFLYYTGNNETMQEIERLVKFNELILRYNTLRLEKNHPVAHTEVPQTTESALEEKTETPKEPEENSMDAPEMPLDTKPENEEESIPDSNEQ